MQSRRLAEWLEAHYTPKHGSWLNMAEIELSALCRQCLNRRIPDLPPMRHETAVWDAHRIDQQPKINWSFRTQDARLEAGESVPRSDRFGEMMY